MEKHALGRFEGLWLTLAVSIPVAVGALAITLYRYHFPGTFEVDQDKWGMFGDFIGGILNPVVGVVTLVLLVKTLLSQQRAIQLQSEELRLQRRELALQRAETAQSTAALNSQHEAIVQQNLEQSLFTWLENYRSLVRDVESDEDDFKVKKGRALLKTMTSLLQAPRIYSIRGIYAPHMGSTEEWIQTLARARLGRQIDALRYWMLLEAGLKVYRRLVDNHHDYFGAIFRTLFRMLEWIDQANLPAPKRWHYVALVRAQLTDSELLLLLFNGLEEKGRKLAMLSNDYALFDNLEMSRDPLLCAFAEGFQYVALDAEHRIRIADSSVRDLLGNWPYRERAFSSKIAKKEDGSSAVLPTDLLNSSHRAEARA